MQSFDPIYLQRLVDGELDRDETRKMLQMAEDNPILWREMASAFAENQLWNTGFQKLELGVDPENTKTVRPASNGNQHTHRISWFAMAALVMVSLTAGLLIGQYQNSGNMIAEPGTNPPQPRTMAKVETPADSAPSLADNQTPSITSAVNFSPDYQMELQDANGNAVFDTEVPLYELTTANKAGYRVDRQPQLPPELVQRVIKRGYWMDQNVNYVSGRLDDGRLFVVPVRTINLVRGQ